MTKEIINRAGECSECLHVSPQAKSATHYPLLKVIKSNFLANCYNSVVKGLLGKTSYTSFLSTQGLGTFEEKDIFKEIYIVKWHSFARIISSL